MSDTPARDSSGNVFADLGLPDADRLLAESELRAEVQRLKSDAEKSRRERHEELNRANAMVVQLEADKLGLEMEVGRLKAELADVYEIERQQRSEKLSWMSKASLAYKEIEGLRERSEKAIAGLVEITRTERLNSYMSLIVYGSEAKAYAESVLAELGVALGDGEGGES